MRRLAAFLHRIADAHEHQYARRWTAERYPRGLADDEMLEYAADGMVIVGRCTTCNAQPPYPRRIGDGTMTVRLRRVR